MSENFASKLGHPYLIPFALQVCKWIYVYRIFQAIEISSTAFIQILIYYNNYKAKALFGQNQPHLYHVTRALGKIPASQPPSFPLRSQLPPNLLSSPVPNAKLKGTDR